MSAESNPVSPELTVNPELLVPLAYSVPYEWGNFHVSQAADEAYGIVPLTPDAVMGGIVPAQRPDDFHKLAMYFNVALLGPGELLDCPEGAGTVLSRRIQSDAGISLQLPGDRQDTLDFMVTHVMSDAMRAQIPEGAVADSNAAAQFIVHFAIERVHDAVQTLAEEFAIESQNRSVLQMVKRRAIMTTIGSGLVLGESAVVFDAITPVMAAGSVGFVALGGVLGYRELRTELNRRPAAQQTATAGAFAMAERVADDLHASFCSNEFESRYGQGEQL